ncbi:archease [Candidatus Woesearchaeota archaeon]|nr:MAG: archease [Candidatus Woesearchaeota archaeon]
MPYKFIENVTRADLCFEATGKNLTALFQSAADAVLAAMADVRSIKKKITKKVIIEAETVEDLLYNFLEEIIFLKDAENLVFADAQVTVSPDQKKATATLFGDTVSPTTQKLHQDVKAVTRHYYKVEKNGEWKTQIVLDI